MDKPKIFMINNELAALPSTKRYSGKVYELTTRKQSDCRKYLCRKEQI